MPKNIVAIGLGSNIDAQQNLPLAAAKLRKIWPDIRFSAVYETAPMERIDQAAFLNAVAATGSEETPERILGILQDIEEKLQKSPPYRYGPRTIDLDLLLYGSMIMPNRETWENAKTAKDPNDHILYLPHLRLDERRFVLEPLCSLIDPAMNHPVLAVTYEGLRRNVREQKMTKTALVL